MVSTGRGQEQRSLGDMLFSPEEIASKDFLTTLRGYDKEEVRAFLRAVSADYARAVDAAQTHGATGASFESLGSEIAQLLQNAQDAADHLRQEAEEEAGELRRRAQERARAVHDAATESANRLMKEAEQRAVEVRARAETETTEIRSSADAYAGEVRSAAERDASTQLQAATERVERLRSTETDLRQRLGEAETVLSWLREGFEKKEDSPTESSPEATSSPKATEIDVDDYDPTLRAEP